MATINNLKMKQVSVICAIMLCIEHCSGQLGEISSKLDFGTTKTTTVAYDSTLSTSLVKALVSLQHSTGPQKTIISSKLDQNPFNLRAIAPISRQNSKTDLSTLGIVCIDGKCNTTDSKVIRSGDKLSTDILVQVTTNVDNKADNKTIIIAGDDNDVPVVVGYAGTNMKPSELDLVGRRIDGSQDITITTETGDNKYNFNYFKDNDVSLKDNGLQHEIPYFEPTLNNHYFGESPPPQFVWYRRRNGHNPHAFNVNSRTYKPYNQWQLKYPTAVPQTHNPSGWSHATRCTCSNPGLKWYPSFGPNQPTPATSVNDKLEPLN